MNKVFATQSNTARAHLGKIYNIDIYTIILTNQNQPQEVGLDGNSV